MKIAADASPKISISDTFTPAPSAKKDSDDDGDSSSNTALIAGVCGGVGGAVLLGEDTQRERQTQTHRHTVAERQREGQRPTQTHTETAALRSAYALHVQHPAPTSTIEADLLCDARF